MFAAFCNVAAMGQVFFSPAIPPEGVEAGLGRRIEIGTLSVDANTSISHFEVGKNEEFNADTGAFAVLSLYDGSLFIKSDTTKDGNDGRFQVNYYTADTPHALRLYISLSNFNTAPFLKMTLRCRFNNGQELVIDVPPIMLNLDFADVFVEGDPSFTTSRIIPSRPQVLGRFSVITTVDPDFNGERVTIPTSTFRVYPSRAVTAGNIAGFTLVYVTSRGVRIPVTSAYEPLATVRVGSVRYFRLRFKNSVLISTLGESPNEGKFEIGGVPRASFPKGGTVTVGYDPGDQSDYQTFDRTYYHRLQRDLKMSTPQKRL